MATPPRSRGLTRSDFRFNETGDGLFYLLELNTQPGMTALSLSPEIAAHAGITFNKLVRLLVEDAIGQGRVAKAS
jgi:D-alanine-D-alanine ligase